MTSVSSAAPNGQPSRGMYSSLVPCIAPPFAATAAITLVFYGFIAKTAQQLGNPVPRMGVKAVLKEGCKAAPFIGIQVGGQMITEAGLKYLQKYFMKGSDDGKDKAPSFAPMLVSSMIVGLISVPPLAVFNGRTMGKTPMQSWEALDKWQTCAVVARETSFLFSLRVSDRVNEFMKRSYGDNKAVELGSDFATGAIGSLVGHPADMAFTLWQNGRKVENFRQTMRGAPVKALTVGTFFVFNKIAKGLIESTAE